MGKLRRLAPCESLTLSSSLLRPKKSIEEMATFRGTQGLLFNLQGDFSTCGSEHRDHNGFLWRDVFLTSKNSGDTVHGDPDVGFHAKLSEHGPGQCWIQNYTIYLSCGGTCCIIFLSSNVSISLFFLLDFCGAFFQAIYGRERQPTFCQNGVSYCKLALVLKQEVAKVGYVIAGGKWNKCY